MNMIFLDSAHPCGSVLVVDDEESNRMLLRDPLEAQGHTVAEATSGQQALDSMTRNLPDVVLLDLMMPLMDGFEVCRRIKENPKWAHVPVLLVTGATDRKERLMAMQVGANDFLTKPIDLTDVILRVRNAVQMKKLFDTAQENLRQAAELKALQQKLTHMIIREMRTPLGQALELLASLKENAGKQRTKKDAQIAEDAWKLVRQTTQRIEQLIDMGDPAATEPKSAAA
jgi:two-component system, sensor histidine kinase and response regulator